MINTVGIIGYGKLGQFLTELGGKYFPDMEIKVHSRRHAPDGKTFFDLKTTAQSDIIFISASISEYEERMKAALENSSPDTIFIDVAAVKKYTSELCQKYGEGRRYISTHPLFGPDSYKKYKNKIHGFQIVVTDYALKNDEYQMLKSKFSALGFSIIEMSADEHDERLAETLFLTHYIGRSIRKAGFSNTEIDTLSFQYLMDAVESVESDQGLFEDIYKYNPHCKNTIEKFKKAQQEVSKELS